MSIEYVYFRLFFSPLQDSITFFPELCCYLIIFLCSVLISISLCIISLSMLMFRTLNLVSHVNFISVLRGLYLLYNVVMRSFYFL